jgi:hypothetical protein
LSSCGASCEGYNSRSCNNIHDGSRSGSSQLHNHDVSDTIIIFIGNSDIKTATGRTKKSSLYETKAEKETKKETPNSQRGR